MRCALWPDGAADHGPEIAMFFASKQDEPTAVLIAEDPAGSMVGFAELSIRVDLPGLERRRVAYVEGLYVPPELRHRNIARKLLRASQDWALQQNCVAFASDRAGRLIFDERFAKSCS